jgi:phospholipid/cholesterol/gamma-HCH transport system substrate-binding protein
MAGHDRLAIIKVDTKANYTLVGAALVVLTVMLVAFIVWLAGRGVKADAVRYTIYFGQTSLNGLQRNSDVTMRGIKVGSVSDFKISPTNIELVRVTIEVDASTPVKKDTKAVLKRNLLTGFAAIDLQGSSRESALLKEAPQGEEYPVIPEGKSEFDEIASSIPGVMQELGEVARRANAFFSEQNKLALSRTLEGTAHFAEAIGNSGDDLRTLIKTSQAFLNDASSLSESMRHFAKTSESEIKEGSERFAENAQKLGAAAESLQKELTALSAALQRATNIFIVETTAVSRDISHAARGFSATMERFEEPRAIILGPSENSLGPGEEVRKR